MPGEPPTADDPAAGREDGFSRTVDVAVVGGGPAGCGAAVFTARYGLDTVVFDRGSSSLRRCAYLENYLGFPAGVDVGTFYELAHDHVVEAGGDLVADLVETVERADGSDGFDVRTQDGRTVRARRVVAATRYDGEYLRPLGGDDLFEVHEHGDHVHERFDRDYPDRNGSTPVDGLYVASPSTAADRQAIVAAGRGARVGLAVVAAARREAGYPEAVATHYDWARRDTAREEEWRDRDRWREMYDERLPEDADLPDERRRELREREIDRRLSTYRTEAEIEAATERGQRRLLDHVDDELITARAREIEAGGASTETGD